MSGFLARWLSRVGLGRGSASFGLGTTSSSSPLVPDVLPSMPTGLRLVSSPSMRLRPTQAPTRGLVLVSAPTRQLRVIP